MPAPLLLAIVAMNLLAILAVGLDKWKARHQRRRLPEAWLLWLAFATGLLGLWSGMSIFRHKTRKHSFRWKLVAVSVINPLWPLLWWQLAR